MTHAIVAYHQLRRRVPLRVASMMLVAALCVTFGAVVLWTWLNPSVLASARTVHLLALLGLFLLPIGVMATDRIDRRHRGS